MLIMITNFDYYGNWNDENEDLFIISETKKINKQHILSFELLHYIYI